MLAAFELVGNPSSIHADGRRARSVVEIARSDVARLIGARPSDVVFTSGASEANATVLAAPWRTIFISPLEHDSVRAAANVCGARVVNIPVKADGTVDTAAFADLVMAGNGRDASGTALVCLQLANNETGVVQPVAEIAEVASRAGIRVHCDAVQAAGRIPIDCRKLGIDFLSISSHKLGGPKGMGALAVVDGAPLPALIHGGGQERGRRAGTENVAGIAGFGAAARLAEADLLTTENVAKLRDGLEALVYSVTPSAVFIGAEAMRLGNTSCFALPGLTSETAVIQLDLAGVSVSSGAACSSGKVGASSVLAAMNVEPNLVRSAIRVSLGFATVDADLSAFIAAWKLVVAPVVARAA